MNTDRLAPSKLFLGAILILLAWQARAQDDDAFDWADQTATDVEEHHLMMEKDQRESDFRYLFQAKNYLINGNVVRARYYLEKIHESRSKVSILKHRYMALIAFTQGDYARSFALLDSPEYAADKYYKQICMLKVLSLMAMKDLKRLPYERTNCQAVTERFSINSQLWLEAMADLLAGKPNTAKGGVLNDGRFILGDPEHLRVWLKLGVYLGQQETGLRALNDLPAESYQSKRVRELIGMLHYRSGNREKALSFVEDIESANAENIKGNLNLEKKEYELAYGHYKLALGHKENSLNAIERALPLTWLLGQWDEGLSLLTRLQDPSLDPRKKLALETAFIIRKGGEAKAEQMLEDLSQLYRGKLPDELEVMAAYVHAYLGKTPAKLFAYSQAACQSHDGLSCWLYLQQGVWENVGKTMARPDETRVDKDRSAESLKEAQAVTAMQEPIIVDQRDIDELDSAQATLDLD